MLYLVIGRNWRELESELERELEREGGERIGCGLREEEEKDPRGGKGVVVVAELN